INLRAPQRTTLIPYTTLFRSIDQAESPKEVTKQKEETKDQIDKIIEDAKVQDAKNKAKNEIEDKADNVKDAIDEVTNVSKKEKEDRKSTRLNSSHVSISYAVF